MFETMKSKSIVGIGHSDLDPLNLFRIYQHIPNPAFKVVLSTRINLRIHLDRPGFFLKRDAGLGVSLPGFPGHREHSPGG